MDIELEARVKSLAYKVKAMSRESPTQKASNVLDSDLRSHWSTSTNTKEWILLELDEPCLLSHIRIYNKSVLEWEIAVGLRYKPDTFVKVRPRCEAPRREMTYSTNYTPCRYVRISCLRGNPIALFFIQLIGVSVSGLEPEFQPVVSHLLPHITSHKQDAHDMHLQLLQDITSRLLVFLPQLEADLTGFLDDAESNIRFVAMLAGPFYPILHVVNERETARSQANTSDFEASKNSQPLSALTVSSNFEPRRSRSNPTFGSSSSSLTVFRPDMTVTLLRKAYKDPNLKTVCRLASRILRKLIEPSAVETAAILSSEVMPSVLDETSKSESSSPVLLLDYSNLFGDEFCIPDDDWESSYLNILDIGAVEEGILHILYVCAAQPQLCSKLADSVSYFWSALPLVQALLPALRPSVSSPENVDDIFSQYKQPLMVRALSQIVVTSSSSAYRSLLHACAGYLASFSPSHAKAACVLIDLCSGVLAPWMVQIIAKIDLTMELLEDLLGTIQGAHHYFARARAAIKYIILALSGHMDDILAKYKEVKHRILFLVEMLEPFLDPAIISLNSTVAFGDISSMNQENEEYTCTIALNVIRTAVQKSAVLASLESEWRRGSVAPSVLLSILEPHMQLPPEIDHCMSPVPKTPEQESSTVSSIYSLCRNGEASVKSNGLDEPDGKTEVSDTAVKMDLSEDVSLFFAPPELNGVELTNSYRTADKSGSDTANGDVSSEEKHTAEKKLPNQFQNGLVLDAGFAAKYFNLHADYLQLMNYSDCELRASEFHRLALDLHSRNDVPLEGHNAAIDALLLAAECYINPFFMMSFGAFQKHIKQLNTKGITLQQNYEMLELKRIFERNNVDLENLAHVERKRDRIVLQILLEAAELDREYHKDNSDGKHCPYHTESYDEKVVNLSPLDAQSADAITLVRQNQALLFNFLIQRLQRERHSMHEILMQGLLLLLHFSTKLYWSPEAVIDIILSSAEYLNGVLTSLYHQFKEGNLQLEPEKAHEVQRRWLLLEKLVIASSGTDEGPGIINRNYGFPYAKLIPPSTWVQKIPTFSTCRSPLVRFIGWMAVSRNAKQYVKDRLFLASDLSQLANLLSIYADELAQVDNIVNKKDKDAKIGQSSSTTNADQSFSVVYPDLSKFFPQMRTQFEAFGEIILEAVGLQLRCLSSGVIPDILCWFSDLCSLPFLSKKQLSASNSASCLKGYHAKNAKAIILYVLEAIVVEHMEAMVPEVPRVVQVLVSLCRTSYCDVSFLGSVMRLLKPIVSYCLHKVSDEEKLLIDDSCLNFESLCFNELLNNLRLENDSFAENVYRGALTIFILASVFPDLSFQRRSEFLQSLVKWANFCAVEPTASFHDYLSAFLCVMGSCKVLLIQTLRVFGALPLQMPQFPDESSARFLDKISESHSWFVDDLSNNSSPTDVCRNACEVQNKENGYHLSPEEIESFCKDLEVLISKLNPTIELCWKFHHQLAKKLTLALAQCLVYSRCVFSIAKKDNSVENDSKNLSHQSVVHWMVGIDGLAEMTMTLLENHCWEVASVMLDCLLGVPQSFNLDNVLCSICSAIKNFSYSAPKISWRLQTDKWLSILFARGVSSLHESEIPLTDLFYTMLGHPEPEQRFISLKHLARLVGQDVNSGLAYTCRNKLVSADLVTSISELNLSHVVLGTWDQVAVLASLDTSLLLRTHAMILLVDYVPYADRQKLQSLLMAADSILHGLGKLAHPNCEGPLLQLSLALIASACLHSPSEDINLIPHNIWRNIETLAMSKTEGKLGNREKRACHALCRLRNEGDEAKEVLKEVLSSSVSEQFNPDFQSTRESILQILADLTSVQSYFDIFSKKIDEEAMELEEAEIELDIVQQDDGLQVSGDHKGGKHSLYPASTYTKEESRLQQIKDSIRSLEKSKIREEIAARMQKKVLARRARQKFLEEVALREAELLQELDRERMTEKEREIERQRLLELEQAKTRELRHILDMEKERVTQRDLQRELEQAESGLRSSRREFSSSSHTSRPRERYRERENGRAGNEGSLRTSSGSYQPETAITSSSMAVMPAVVLSGSRSFSGQLPTILQSRERPDECGSSYEENLDGSKDSGDTGSVGDPELVSAFDAQTGGYGTTQRHGSRGSKSRQIMERRERDGRREGKWERKHS